MKKYKKSKTTMVEEISLENVLRRCGDFNRFHLIHYFFLSILNFGSGVTGFYYVFGLAEPFFRCRLPTEIWPHEDRYESMNTSHQSLIDSLQLSRSKCDNLNGTMCNNYVYDRSIFGLTFTEEGNFVCNRALQKTWMSTAYQIGTFSIIITGSIGDRIGRRKMIQILTLILFIVTAITQLLLQFVHMTVNAKFILLFVNQLVSSLDGYSMSFLLLMELTSSSHTSFAGGLTLIAYTIGEILVAIFSFISRDWLKLKWLTSIYFLVTLPYLYFIPESPYWLHGERRYDELETSLRKIAKMNGREESEWFPYYTRLIRDPHAARRISTVVKRTHKQSIFRFLPRLAMIIFIEFVIMLLYTTISYGLGAMNDTLNPHWNFIIGAVTEAVGYTIATFLIVTRLGRKYTLFSCALMTAICVVIIPFITKPSPLATIIVSQLSKLGISGMVAVSWIYVPELFPTAMRGLVNAVFVFVGSCGSIVAPIVDAALGKTYKRFSFYIYAALTLTLAMIICILPETRNRSFNDAEERDNTTQTDDLDDVIDTKF